jgi:hypothetical protein
MASRYLGMLSLLMTAGSFVRIVSSQDVRCNDQERTALINDDLYSAQYPNFQGYVFSYVFGENLGRACECLNNCTMVIDYNDNIALRMSMSDPEGGNQPCGVHHQNWVCKMLRVCWSMLRNTESDL